MAEKKKVVPYKKGKKVGTCMIPKKTRESNILLCTKRRLRKRTLIDADRCSKDLYDCLKQMFLKPQKITLTYEAYDPEQIVSIQTQLMLLDAIYPDNKLQEYFRCKIGDHCSLSLLPELVTFFLFEEEKVALG